MGQELDLVSVKWNSFKVNSQGTTSSFRCHWTWPLGAYYLVILNFFVPAPCYDNNQRREVRGDDTAVRNFSLRERVQLLNISEIRTHCTAPFCSDKSAVLPPPQFHSQKTHIKAKQGTTPSFRRPCT